MECKKIKQIGNLSKYTRMKSDNYFNSDEFKKKLQQYREMLQSGERVYFDADTLLDIAEYFDATHRHDLARDCANYAHQLHPDEALPLIYMARLSLDDGKLELRVNSTDGTVINALVVRGGLLKANKGLNLPGRTASLSAITKKDIEYIKLGLEWKVDYMALSFVRTGEDVLKAKHCMEMYGGQIPLISKIEKPEALANIDEIIKNSEGIMVARGDLGIEISAEKVPAAQKRLIKECNAKNKVVIVATQMLETMIEQPIPTRAEASDVANAILDGADAIMLSGETAVGKYPVEAVKMMSKISQNLEENNVIRHNYYSRKMEEFDNQEAFAMCHAMITMLDSLPIKALVTFTTTGYTPALLSKAKPSVPIYALAQNDKVCRQMNLFRDVIPFQYDWQQEISLSTLKALNALLIKEFKMKKGDKVILTGVVPYTPGHTTNFIKLKTIE